MRTALAVLAIAALALAGCSSKSGSDLYTCQKTGRVVDLSKVAGSDKKGFDKESACPAPIPPSILLTALPTSVQGYIPVSVGWSIDLGNYTQGGGHTMLTQLMWSHHPVAADGLKDPSTYSANAPLVMYAHQELDPPRTPFSGKVTLPAPGMSFPGTYYLRVYAQVRNNVLADTDIWSPEVQVKVNPANATGSKLTVTHAQGPNALSTAGVGTLTASATKAQLGDALVIQNNDVTDHTFTITGVCAHPDLLVKAQSASTETILLTMPGSCNVKSDDTGTTPQVSFNVNQPT